MDSNSIFQQIQEMGQMPEFRTQLADLYNKPVFQPLTQEAADLESQYLPAIFQPFLNTGTSAADLSPAAKLAAIGQSLGRLGGRVGANQSVQNFYGMQIQDLANQAGNQWQSKRQNLWDMYNAKAQQERDAAERAYRASQTPSIDWNALSGMFRSEPGATRSSSTMDRAVNTAKLYSKALPLVQNVANTMKYQQAANQTKSNIANRSVNKNNVLTKAGSTLSSLFR